MRSWMRPVPSTTLRSYIPLDPGVKMALASHYTHGIACRAYRGGAVALLCMTWSFNNIRFRGVCSTTTCKPFDMAPGPTSWTNFGILGDQRSRFEPFYTGSTARAKPELSHDRYPSARCHLRSCFGLDPPPRGLCLRRSKSCK